MTKSSCQLLTWKDPIKSGQVFGGIVFALISIKTINLINVIFRLGAVTLFVAAAAEYAGKLTTGVGFVTRFRPEYQKSDIPAKYASHVATVLEKLQLESQKILYAKDIEVTLKSAGICYFMYKLTALISLWSLAFLSVITAFTVPALYEKYQKEIDTAVADYSKLAKEKALDVQKQAYEKAGPMLEQAESKMGPVGAFIRSKVPVRTASSTVDSPVSSPAVEKTPLEFSSKPADTTTAKPIVAETVRSSDQGLADVSNLPSVPTSVQKEVETGLKEAHSSGAAPLGEAPL